jgi:glycosyltransferase involved in cell wall biosynthesis
MRRDSSPFFSIIVPIYNRAAFLPALIESVLQQTYVSFELIIVNDGSTDDSENVVRQYTDSRIKYIATKNNERAAARNYGAHIARGDYFNFFDSDDRMLPHHLSTAWVYLNSYKFPRWFHTGFVLVDENGNTISEERGELTQPEKRLIVTNYLGCDSVFIERSLFMETQFNPERVLASSEDWELWLRLISRERLFACQTITFQMIHHKSRSLLTISPDRIIERDTYLLHSLLRDKAFCDKFYTYLDIFEADRYTFFSLCLLLAKRRKEATEYLWRSLITSPRVLLRRRFWACVKLILLSNFPNTH